MNVTFPLAVCVLAASMLVPALVAPALGADDPAQGLTPAELAAKAGRILAASGTDECGYARSGDAPELMQSYQISFNYDFEGTDYPVRNWTLFRFLCFNAAYNELTAFLIADEYDEVRALPFAIPEFDVKYVNDDADGPVESITLTGFTTRNILVNSGYDPKTRTISAFAKWRGLGDASSRASWKFSNGKFVLVTYAVDATYDGAFNDVLLIDKGLPVADPRTSPLPNPVPDND
jgi:uncharacterized protein DUF1176